MVLAVLLTPRSLRHPIFGEGDSWNASAQTYLAVAATFPEGDNSVVAVNNPPGFFAHSQISAVVIPSGTEQSLRKVVESFNAGWVVLEANHPSGLDSLYADPGSATWLTLVETIQAQGSHPVHIFR